MELKSRSLKLFISYSASEIGPFEHSMHLKPIAGLDVAFQHDALVPAVVGIPPTSSRD